MTKTERQIGEAVAQIKSIEDIFGWMPKEIGEGWQEEFYYETRDFFLEFHDDDGTPEDMPPYSDTAFWAQVQNRLSWRWCPCGKRWLYLRMNNPKAFEKHEEAPEEPESEEDENGEIPAGLWEDIEDAEGNWIGRRNVERGIG